MYLSVSFVRHQQSSANTLFCFKISSVSHIDGHGQSSTWYSGRRTSTTKKGSRSSSSCIAMVLILASSETSFQNATSSIARHCVKLTGWCVNWSTEGVGSSGMYVLVAACSYSHVLNSVVILSLSYDNEELQLTSHLVYYIVDACNQISTHIIYSAQYHVSPFSSFTVVIIAALCYRRTEGKLGLAVPLSYCASSSSMVIVRTYRFYQAGSRSPLCSLLLCSLLRLRLLATSR